MSLTKKALIGTIIITLTEFILPTNLTPLLLPIAFLMEEIDPPSRPDNEKPYSTGTTPKAQTPEPATITEENPRGEGVITKTYGTSKLEVRPNDLIEYRVKKEKEYAFGEEISTEECASLIQYIIVEDRRRDSSRTSARTQAISQPDRTEFPPRDASSEQLRRNASRYETLDRGISEPSIKSEKFSDPPVVSIDSDHYRMNDPEINIIVEEAELTAANAPSNPSPYIQPKYPYPWMNDILWFEGPELDTFDRNDRLIFETFFTEDPHQTRYFRDDENPEIGTQYREDISMVWEPSEDGQEIPPLESSDEEDNGGPQPPKNKEEGTNKPSTEKK